MNESSNQNRLAHAHLAVCGLAHAQGGPRTYAMELLRGIFQTDQHPDRLTVISDDPDYFTGPDAPPWVAGARFSLPQPALRPLVESISIPRLLKAHRADLYHSTKNYLPGGLPCPAVVTIHDLAPFVRPDTFTTLSGAYLRYAIRSACRRAQRIIADSTATADDIVEILGQPRDKIDVIHLGISPHLLRPAAEAEKQEIRRRYNLRDGPVVLCLGTIQPRKHQQEVLAAFLAARRKLPEGTTCLFVGRRGWKTAGFENALEQASCREIRWVQRVPDEDLRGLYAVASLFASPGDCEGFGLTNLEAMAQGTPTIALNKAAVPEVLGDGALLVDEPDPDLIAEQMIRLFSDEPLRRELGRAGRKKALTYTWERAALTHLETYARTLEVV